MQINFTYDQAAGSLPAGFVDALNSVASYFDNLFSDPITVNIDVGYGEVDSYSVAFAASVFNVNYFTYAQVRAALGADATSSDDATALLTLPLADPTGGATFGVQTAQAKALRLTSGNSGSVDGWIGFSTAYSWQFGDSSGVTSGYYDFLAAAKHEVSEVLGRTSIAGGVSGSDGYTIMDLFRYSASGVRDLTYYPPVGYNNATYFSIDSGSTNLNNWNNPNLANGDLGDWAPSAGADAFDNQLSSGLAAGVTQTDIRLLDVIGYTPFSAAGLLRPHGMIAGTTPQEIVNLALANVGDAWVSGTTGVAFCWGISDLAGIPFFDLSDHSANQDPRYPQSNLYSIPSLSNGDAAGDYWYLVDSNPSVATLESELQAGDIVRINAAGNTAEASFINGTQSADEFIVVSGTGANIQVVDVLDGKVAEHSISDIVSAYASGGSFYSAYVQGKNPEATL